jgi:lipoate-protein ligase B
MQKPYVKNIRCDSELLFCDLKKIEYEEAFDLQHRIVDAMNKGSINHDFLFILEHPPVFTLGKNGGRENLVVSDSFLKERHIKTVQIERGGNITYHGPGQLVAYPILNINKMALAVKDYVDGLEEVMIRTASNYGITAERNEKNHGIWIKNSKLGSIGLAIKRGVSFHGLAMNINMSLEPFSWINPCGLSGVTMTSLKHESGTEIPINAATDCMRNKFSDVFGFNMNKITQKELESMLKTC